jgi:hypothetical protein
MGRHVGECIRIQQEPSSRLDDVCDTIKTCGVSHLRGAQSEVVNGVPTLVR